ncbi:MAG TPA: hypothetical protein VOA87_22990 [Thermoanaerobaculia bacterium]|nr:hypothetical protein [Thermoanaerobaculia bacterium]
MKLDLQRAARRWVQRPEWLWAFAAATAACLLVYGINAATTGMAEVRPGSVWGRTYGALAALLMVGAALLGVRRRTMRWSLGRAQDWVQFHVYGGTLALLLVLLHSGFRRPVGGLGWWLLALTLWVTLSGLLGVVLRKWIPRLLASGLNLEVLYERIPELTADVRKRAEALMVSAPAPVEDFYRQRIAPDLVRPRVRLIYFLDITGGIQDRLREFGFLRRLLSPEERPRLDELESLYRVKLEMDAHFTLQKALRFWLYGHVPVSLVLLLLVAIHVVSVLYY